MKSFFAAALAVFLCLNVAPATAQDQPQDPAAAQAAFLDSIKLTPEHQQLKRLVGQWTTEMKSYYEDPNIPTVSKGLATFTMLFDDRYLQQVFKGEYAGIPFEGIGVTGFDKSKKKFVGTWIDNFETGIMTTEGTYDEKTSTMTEIGTSQTPAGEMKMKNVTKEIDDDSFVFKMYMLQPDGSETLGMEITYRRVKK